MEGLVEEALRQFQAAREGAHQCLTDLHHAMVVIRDRCPPSRQGILGWQRGRFAQRSAGTDNRRSVCDVRSHVNSFLTGQESSLPRKPTAVDIWIRGPAPGAEKADVGCRFGDLPVGVVAIAQGTPNRDEMSIRGMESIAAVPRESTWWRAF